MGQAQRRYRSSRKYQEARRQMFAIYGRTCHLCGHGGALEADHLTPLALDPDQPPDPHAMRPAHGVNGRCTTCGRACNQERSAGPITKLLKTSEDW